jgi:F-type H+-transporting ATPase subunit b
MLLASANFGLRFILEVVGLLIAIALVLRYVWPPLRAAMARQEERIRAELEAGAEARAAAEQLVAERRAELERARVEAAEIVAQARRSAEQVVEEGRQRAEAERRRLVARAAADVELERARAREEIAGQFAALVVEAAEAVVEAELDETIHRRLIDQAISAAEAEEA